MSWAMWPGMGRCSMSPAEDASLLLRIVRRHLQAMQLHLDSRYPEEEWVSKPNRPWKSC